MAKGKGERKGGGGGGAPEEEQEQKLQAILLADSFNANFRPISSDTPKVRTHVDLDSTHCTQGQESLFRASGRGGRGASILVLLLPVLMEMYCCSIPGICDEENGNGTGNTAVRR